ncbi:DNA polymerase IV [Candidatus Dojkabacteria bacterium]|uniref:DNA polymerase IV n=1 Tax=Candidatus Dojkabacteria bacterium TaxID=2099670 RepID=A0A955RI39_9BACT|nr:DNA polymerase IV [Candidatus Dojkabacteria bacterium]
MCVPRWYTPIAHIDADCFYASCEMVRNPGLKNKDMAVVSRIGKMVLAKSYEAKAKGIKTGMPPWEAKKLAPKIILIDADFDFYAKLSRQLFQVLKSFSPNVEERSVDEGYLDLKGLRGLYHKTFEQIGTEMQSRVYLQTGLPVSIGIANTKIISKIASDFNKPKGVKIVDGRSAERFLKEVEIGDVPGFGSNKTSMLNKFGIYKAQDLASLDFSMANSILDKAGVGIWHELNGRQVWKMEIEKKPQQTISKTASFIPSRDKDYLFSELVNNLERALSKLNKEKMLVKSVQIFLRDTDYHIAWDSIELPQYTNRFEDISRKMRESFEKLCESEETYRATGIVFTDIILKENENLAFFDNMLLNNQKTKFESIKEELNRKYGRDIITVAAKKTHRENTKDLSRLKYNWLGKAR